MKVKSESEVAQSCLTLSDLMACSLPGSSVHGIFQARVLEWGAIAFSKSGLKTPIQRQFSLELARCSNSISHSNKLYFPPFPLFLSHVWKFFSNPHPDHDKYQKLGCLKLQTCIILCLWRLEA